MAASSSDKCQLRRIGAEHIARSYDVTGLSLGEIGIIRCLDQIALQREHTHTRCSADDKRHAAVLVLDCETVCWSCYDESRLRISVRCSSSDDG